MKKVISLLSIIIVSICIIVFCVICLIQNNTQKNNETIPNNITHVENPETNINDITFLGDSITAGYVSFKKISEDRVISKVGLAGTKMFNQTLIYNKEDVYLEQTLAKLQPKVLYIGFGMNDLKDTEENFYNVYKSNIQKIMDITPNTKIVLVSITPINNSLAKNETVDSFNATIKRIVEEINSKKCKYFDVHDILSGSDGYLKAEYNSGDGIHLNATAYDKLIEYISKNPQY